MTRAAMEFISGPAVKRIRLLSPNFLLKAASSYESPFFPPKVVGPATKRSSRSVLAAAISGSRVPAGCDGEATAENKNKRRTCRSPTIFFLTARIFIRRLQRRVAQDDSIFLAVVT